MKTDMDKAYVYRSLLSTRWSNTSNASMRETGSYFGEGLFSKKLVGLLTGHCHLKGHLFKLGLTDDPTCERCLQKDESATHILCDCEAIAHL
jgi:hypothetical protein